METEKQHFGRYYDPVVLSIGAAVLGFALGTGRWQWLLSSGRRVAEGVGTLVLTQMMDSMHKYNPGFFKTQMRTTH